MNKSEIEKIIQEHKLIKGCSNITTQSGKNIIEMECKDCGWVCCLERKI